MAKTRTYVFVINLSSYAVVAVPNLEKHINVVIAGNDRIANNVVIAGNDRIANNVVKASISRIGRNEDAGIVTLNFAQFVVINDH